MMHKHSFWTIIMLAGFLLLGFGASETEAKWKKVAELTAGEGAREVAINRNAREFRIICTEGTVIINTVVVREGGKKTDIRIAQRLNKGDSREFSIPNKVQVTGLRISDNGRGQYVVHVKE